MLRHLLTDCGLASPMKLYTASKSAVHSYLEVALPVIDPTDHDGALKEQDPGDPQRSC